jgi:hypothetical protein
MTCLRVEEENGHGERHRKVTPHLRNTISDALEIVRDVFFTRARQDVILILLEVVIV